VLERGRTATPEVDDRSDPLVDADGIRVDDADASVDVDVGVDEAGGDHLASRIDHVCAGRIQCGPDGGDAPGSHAHIQDGVDAAARIQHPSAGDDGVKAHPLVLHESTHSRETLPPAVRLAACATVTF